VALSTYFTRGASEMNVTFVHKPGDTVQLAALKIPGVVTGCLVDSDGCQYRVVWWWDGTRRSEWLYGYELTSAAEPK
jgi:hypothetical protein